MKILSAELSGWRNYERQVVEFGESPLIFLGANGQGKTNFIESLVYVSLGRSHRTSTDAVLVNPLSSSAVIRLTVGNGARQLSVDVQVNTSGTNTFRLNGNPTKRKELTRLLPLVLFAPEDMDIVRGDPESRRQFLADIATETSATLVADLADYDKIVRQRNTLLKSMNPSVNESTILDAWTTSLISVATRIMIARRSMVKVMAPLAAQHYSAISSSQDKFDVSLVESIGTGVPDDAIESTLTELFHVKRREEIERGVTLVGPHRDDLSLVLNGLPARTHSSQGEAWSCALAVKLTMIDVVRRVSIAGDPVVILDDVFSELDPERRQRLAEHLTNIEQVIITTADPATVPLELNRTVHRVVNGAIDV